MAGFEVTTEALIHAEATRIAWCHSISSTPVIGTSMSIQFHFLLHRRSLEAEDKRQHTKHDAAQHSELVHIREQHRLALQPGVEHGDGEVRSIGDIARC